MSGWREREWFWLCSVLVIAVSLVVMLCCLLGCQTAQAISDLPVGYGAATWSIIEALWRDLMSLVDMLL